jgi:uncharacterized peroxidase-related enzyme
MSRVPLLSADAAPNASQPLLAQIHDAFGATPNMFRAVANSPAALVSMWGSFAALGAGRLPGKLSEPIAVAVAAANQCHYCLAAHTALGRKAGASADEMREAQTGHSNDPKTAAALGFAIKLVEQRGAVESTDLQALRNLGFDDGELVEIVAHVALNLFTNYVNIAFDTPVDFPAVKLRAAA